MQVPEWLRIKRNRTFGDEWLGLELYVWKGTAILALAVGAVVYSAVSVHNAKTSNALGVRSQLPTVGGAYDVLSRDCTCGDVLMRQNDDE